MSVLFAFLNSGAAVGTAIGELLQYGWRFLRNLFLPKAVLGFPKLDVETVRKYMVGGGTFRRRSGTWLSFLRNHLQVSWAVDFFTVTTVGFGRLYVFVVLEHGRRRVVHWAISAGPTMTWVIQQLREATPFGLQPQYLFRDKCEPFKNVE